MRYAAARASCMTRRPGSRVFNFIVHVFTTLSSRRGHRNHEPTNEVAPATSTSRPPGGGGGGSEGAGWSAHTSQGALRLAYMAPRRHDTILRFSNGNAIRSYARHYLY